jgi:hypothetical protein
MKKLPKKIDLRKDLKNIPIYDQGELGSSAACAIAAAMNLPLEKLTDVYGPGDDDYGRNPSPFKKPTKSVMDVCVDCGKTTIYPKNIHIDYRMNYVEGAGQLCSECYNKIYNKLP